MEEKMEPLTVEEARTVELPINPITRIRKLGELASGFRLLPRSGALAAFSLPEVITRGRLVRLAHMHEFSDGLAKRIVAAADAVSEAGDDNE